MSRISNSVTGQGITGTWGERRLALGNAVLMRAQGVALDAAQDQSDALRKTGQTVMFLAIDGRLAGFSRRRRSAQRQHALLALRH